MEKLILIALAIISTSSFANVTSTTRPIMDENFNHLDELSHANELKSLGMEISIDDLNLSVIDIQAEMLAIISDMATTKDIEEVKYLIDNFTDNNIVSTECKIVDSFGEEVIGWLDVDCESKTFTYDTGFEVVDVTEYVSLANGIGHSALNGDKYYFEKIHVPFGAASSDDPLSYWMEEAYIGYGFCSVTLMKEKFGDLYYFEFGSNLFYTYTNDGGLSFYNTSTSPKAFSYSSTGKRLGIRVNGDFSEAWTGGTDLDSMNANIESAEIGATGSNCYYLERFEYTIPGLPSKYKLPLSIK